tara:strand:- start:28 stop:486 length:459 start_codon:yes stop_codon:yes gene_type:complete
MDLLNKINKIPLEVAMIIKTYIPREIIIITNKKDYENEYMTLRLEWNDALPYKISYKRHYTLESYIQKIIRNNLNYIFEMVIKYKYSHWVNIKKYRYNGYKYGNYIQFLEQLCIILESTKCKEVIKNFEKKNGIVRKKKHKKIRRITNTWTN